MSETVLGLRQCPECGGEKLIPVRAGEKTNFFCEDCVLCWHLEHGRATIVDPQTCPGCELGTTACFERWDVSARVSRGLSTMTRQHVVAPGISSQTDTIGWGDIESELYCSDREACVGCFPFARLQSD